MLLRVTDIETTGLAPPAEIIEVGYVDVITDGDNCRIERPISTLYRPLNGIPPVTMAVHHITEEDISADSAVCSEDQLAKAVWKGDAPDAFVAHNSAFETSFIPAAITKNVPWICTLKCALRIWPDAPGYSNQILRYWRNLKIDRVLAMPPHRAGPDAWVTAHLLTEMLRSASIPQMITWTKEPKLLPNMTFGKHKNSRWSDIPADYLQWMIKQADMDRDAVWCAKQELARRSQ